MPQKLVMLKGQAPSYLGNLDYKIHKYAQVFLGNQSPDFQNRDNFY